MGLGRKWPSHSVSTGLDCLYQDSGGFIGDGVGVEAVRGGCLGGRTHGAGLSVILKSGCFPHRAELWHLWALGTFAFVDPFLKKNILRESPGGPVAKSLPFQCRGQGFGLGN